VADNDDALRPEPTRPGPDPVGPAPEVRPVPPPPVPPGPADATAPIDPVPPAAGFRGHRPGFGAPAPTQGSWPHPPRPDTGGRPPQPGRQPQSAPPAPPPGPWPGGQPAEPGSFAERFRADELVPPRRNPPANGWRRWVYRASFGLINPGPSPEELRQAQLEARIRGPLRGHFKIGVFGKGGVGKTTVSACVGSVFAELRVNDRVVAVDADTSFGKLGSRIDPNSRSSFWDLAADRDVDSFADIRGHLGSNAGGLFVLAGEPAPARRRVLDPAVYREAMTRLDRHFGIAVVDCSSTMDSPVTQEVLKDLDALIVVSSPWIDGAAAAGQTLDWLHAHGRADLLQRTVIVLNDSDGHADKRTRAVLARQFAGHGKPVIEIPFDGRLRPGGVIDGTAALSPATRRPFIEVAAALAEHYPTGSPRPDAPLLEP